MLSEELILIISMLIEANSYLHVNQYNFLDSHKKRPGMKSRPFNVLPVDPSEAYHRSEFSGVQYKHQVKR